jgi:hypothetical protein
MSDLIERSVKGVGGHGRFSLVALAAEKASTTTSTVSAGQSEIAFCKASSVYHAAGRPSIGSSLVMAQLSRSFQKENRMEAPGMLSALSPSQKANHKRGVTQQCFEGLESAFSW